MTIEVRENALPGPVNVEPETGMRWIDGTAGAVSVSSMEPVVRKLGREIAQWMGDVNGRSPRAGGPSMINRQAYSAPNTPYASMRLAHAAVEHDDVVGGVADVTEGLMFQGLQFESRERDEMDCFNQIATDLNLDQLARQWHREEFTYSQIIIGMWWGPRSYTARTKSESGKRSKKRFDIWCPLALTFLDPRKVVPLQPGPFGQDRLAWQASQDEYAEYITAWDTGAYGDALMREFFNGPTRISEAEKQYLRTLGVQPEYLIDLNPSTVKRYTSTKSHYERFATVRLKRVFKWLDLKENQIEADRVTIVGAANYILLIRQGSKEQPASQAEIDNLAENFKVIAKVPVVTGDHRLQIDIITPDQEQTLNTAKYDTIDRRIVSSTLGALGISSSGQRNESTLTTGRFVGRLLESRRKMFRRWIEENVCRAIVEHPRNEGRFKEEPNLTFTPRLIQLDSDAEFFKSVLALRTQKELSRQSTLETFGFDQEVEAMWREIEEEEYDDTFKTAVPFDSPDNQANADSGDAQDAEDQGEEAPQVSGARGGRPKGGGKPKQSPQGALD